MWARTRVGDWKLPPKRYRMGGTHFRSDGAFLASAVRDVGRLQVLCGLDEDCRLVDWGCGVGRLAYGVRETFGQIRSYNGIDVQPKLIGWAQHNLVGDGFRFTLASSQNERYNPSGSDSRTIPVEARSVDVLYAYSVFSHLDEGDTGAYLTNIGALLSEKGRAFVTCFVEENVPAWSENPEGYGPLPWKGRLHCSRFSRERFEQLIEGAGLSVKKFEHGLETDGQSLYILQRS